MGRMVVGERYKYILYDEGASREQLMDLGEDPCETRNFARRESHAEILSRMRAAYREWFPDPPREMEGAR